MGHWGRQLPLVRGQERGARRALFGRGANEGAKLRVGSRKAAQVCRRAARRLHKGLLMLLLRAWRVLYVVCGASGVAACATQGVWHNPEGQSGTVSAQVRRAGEVHSRIQPHCMQRDPGTLLRVLPHAYVTRVAEVSVCVFVRASVCVCVRARA